MMWHPYTIMCGAFASAYTLYRISTYRETRIWVKEKYFFTGGRAMPHYGFSTSDGTLYRVPYSMISCQWNPREMWSGVQPGGVYGIRYWGIDCPEWGLYRCVDRIQVIQDATEHDVERDQKRMVEL
jgi:hypothetical protein